MRMPFVFIYKTQLLESFPHIKGSLPVMDLYTGHVRVTSDLLPGFAGQMTCLSPGFTCFCSPEPRSHTPGQPCRVRRRLCVISNPYYNSASYAEVERKGLQPQPHM